MRYEHQAMIEQLFRRVENLEARLERPAVGHDERAKDCAQRILEWIEVSVGYEPSRDYRECIKALAREITR
jgi:hypothetical protein